MGRRSVDYALRRVAVSAAAIGASWWLVRTDRARPFDDAVASVLRRPLGPAADLAVGAATDLGSVYGIIGAAGLLAAIGKRQAAVDVFGSGSMAWITAQAAKPLIDRPRPYQQAEAERLVAEPMGSSWPSGHSAVAAAMATSVADQGGHGATTVGTTLVAFVAASRIYVGVHHATDPVAGVGIGVISATLWRLARRLVDRPARWLFGLPHPDQRRASRGGRPSLARSGLSALDGVRPSLARSGLSRR